MKYGMLLSMTVLSGLSACGGRAGDPVVPDPPYVVRQDSPEIIRKEAGPHEGTGETTAYRYFDDVQGAKLIFRKRALHKGASIGLHALSHDEVYYVISGRGEYFTDKSIYPVGAGSAVFMREGVPVGIRQVGEEDLVLIVAYPPAEH